jgi:hypothetical protein
MFNEERSMTDTAQCSSFSTRSNAKRGAEKMINNGTAPAVDFAIRPRDDGRFEIIWKATKVTPTTEEVEAELTAATEMVTDSRPADPTPNQGEIDAQPVDTGEPRDCDKAAPEIARAETQSTPTSAESQRDPFPVGTWVTVRQGKRKTSVGQVRQRINEEHWRVHLLGKPEEWTIMATAAQLSCPEEPAPEAPKPAKRSRRRKTSMPTTRSRSQYAISPDMIAVGKLPENPPVVTSKANPHYQRRFDTLHGYAAAGDWDAVRNYKATGSNSYSKMVARYRQDLLALHAASEAAQ